MPFPRSFKFYLKILILFLLFGAILQFVRNSLHLKSTNFQQFRGDKYSAMLKNDEPENIVVKESRSPGEQGIPYILPSKFQQEKDALYRVNGFNARASDDIAYDRSLPDIRHPKCKELIYPQYLLSTSVIIPFFNEHWSTLVRTFTSVLNRSPAEFLLEVILVDDGSKKDFLKSKLDDYILKYPKVSVLRLPKRQGLIKARLMGAKQAKGDVLIFLDSHTECNIGWLPPLLAPITKNKTTCVCPFIDVIDYENFAYREQDNGARGAFDWGLFYKRLPLLDSDVRHMPEPFKSPVMAGGLFAISTEFFWYLGGYDPGLRIWGGEQYELSFKIWMCGGTMLDAPCSRVGHIYRKFSPVFGFEFPDNDDDFTGGPYLQRNHKRVAEVWMDEYADYVYRRFPLYYGIDAGDLTERKAIRERLKCKSFRWFMKEVAFDLIRNYPPIEPKGFANGTIKSLSNPFLCIDTQLKGHEERFGLRACGEGEQKFDFSWHKDIRPLGRSLCWDVSKGDERSPVLLYTCHGGKGNQLWKYDHVNQMLIHGNNPRCLEANPSLSEIYVTSCNTKKVTQKWIVENVDKNRLALWDNESALIDNNF